MKIKLSDEEKSKYTVGKFNIDKYNLYVIVPNGSFITSVPDFPDEVYNYYDEAIENADGSGVKSLAAYLIYIEFCKIIVNSKLFKEYSLNNK